MSDVPQGPGWWQASDDKWYPPPRPTMPGEDQQPGGAAPSAPPEGMAPPVGAPSGPGFGPPMAPPGPMGPPGAPMGGPPSYGGYPQQGPPPGGGQNRTPLFVALGVVAVAALVGVGLVVTSGGDDDDPTPTTIETANTSGQTTPPTDGPSNTDGPDEPSEPSGSGSAADIEVVETGFTNFEAQYDDENHVSYGYILENTGDEPVSNIEVTVTLKDGDGTVVSSDTDTIYLIQPGGKVGLGDEPYEEIAEVAEMEVQASIPSYASPAEELGEITAGDVSTTEDSSWKTTFTASSTYEVQLDGPYAYVIYRNADGDIVGGSYGFMNVVEAGGSTSGEVTSYEPIPGVDPAQTEVYVDPGYIY
jgi:hypothetical protein